MAIKLGVVRKRCPQGELYVFKNGVAEVPGARFQGAPLTISLSEFNALIKEIQKNG